MAILEFADVTLGYGRGRGRKVALADVGFVVPAGALCLLMGPSGAGKSTLLRLVLAMQRPDRGIIRVAGRDIHRLRRASIPYLRRNVGAIFQDFKLLADATPVENVALALAVLGRRRREVLAGAREALRRVEIDPGLRRPVRCMSGGEQQRVAVARALASEPALLLADEPTGNLDRRLTGEIVELLDGVRRQGTTVVLASHDPDIAQTVEVTQTLRLEQGRVVYDSLADARRREPFADAAEVSPSIGAVA